MMTLRLAPATSLLLLAACAAPPPSPPPDVPASLRVPDKLALAAQVPATGVQIYDCAPSKADPGKYEWAYRAPEAQLFDTTGRTIGKHYGGPTWESNEGGKVIIRARSSHDYHSQNPGIRITVADSGVGISPAHREKIFTPFFSTKKEVGTGLGLWITKDLLEKKGGSIHFRSRQSAPSGTVMSLFLPMAVSNTRTEVAA